MFLAEKFLECQAHFTDNGSPATVTLAYHYTKSQNMDTIRQDGLMTHSDRKKQNVSAAIGGTYFGEGVYMGRNPFAFQNFGDVGLLVAVLLGNTERVGRGAVSARSGTKPKAPNTIIRNKIQLTPRMTKEGPFTRNLCCRSPASACL